LRQDEIEQATAARLEELRLNPDTQMTRWTLSLAALQEYGLPILEMNPDEASRKIAASPIRDALVIVVDELASTSDPVGAHRLLSIARNASDDPWRQRYFDARLRNDKAAIRDQLKEPDTLRQPPAMIAHLVFAMKEYDNAAAKALCQQGLVLYPGDLWLIEASSILGIRFAQAEIVQRLSLALRPNSPSMNLRLAASLELAGQDEEAIPLYDRCIRFQTDPSPWPPAHVHTRRALAVGRVLERQGKLAQAIEAYQEGYQEGLRHGRLEGDTAVFDLLTRLIDALERNGGPAEAVLRLLPDYAKALPASGYDALKRGDLLVRWGKPREAIESYAEGISRIYWADHSADVKLVELLTRSGLLDETLEAWRKKAKANLGSLKVCLPLCVVLEKTGRQEEAFAIWERAAASTDHRDWNERGWVYYGDALARAKKLTEAAEAYRKATALAPDVFTGSHVVALQVTVARERLTRADALRAKGDGQKAADEYREAIKLDPKNMEPYGKLGMALLGLKGDAKGDRAAGCRKAVELYPNYPYAHLALGGALCLTDRAGALAATRKAIELNPQDAFAYSCLGDLLADPRFVQSPKKDDVAAALAAYSKAIELEPKVGDHWAVRGNLYQRQRNWESALADYDKAITLPMGFGHSVWLERGIAQAALGRWDQAVTDYSRSLQIAPSFFAAWRQRAIANQRLGKWDQAIKDLEECFHLQSEDPFVPNDLAWLLATCPDPMRRNPTRAVELARKAVDKRPGEGTFWNTLGAAHYRAGDWKACAVALNKSMELSSGGDPYDWFFLAMAHRKMDDPTEARKWFDRAVDWMYKNGPSRKYNRQQGEELHRFQSEAEDVLELRKK
jgi:tetratricopeptide (TPR) repeat protein